MGKYQVEWPGHLAEVERIDEQTRVPDLSPATATHEASKLLLTRPPLPGRLLLEGAEGLKITLRVHDLFHSVDTESADQLVLQVCHAHVETKLLHVGPGEIRAKAGSLETTLELALLGGVTETGQPRV
jgi:hypothetical protein